jgi:hypothetical protein
MIHRVPKRAMCEETLEDLEDHFGDEHLAAAYHSQLKTRTQRIGESLQKFATVVEQLAHRTYPALSKDHVRMKAGTAFAEGLDDPKIKIQLLLGGEKTVN